MTCSHQPKSAPQGAPSNKGISHPRPLRLVAFIERADVAVVLVAYVGTKIYATIILLNVCMVIAYSKRTINRARLPILLVVS